MKTPESKCNRCIDGRGSDRCMCEIPESKRPLGGFRDDRSYRYSKTNDQYYEVPDGIPSLINAEIGWWDAATDALDALADQYGDNPNVVGFRVFGPMQCYEDYWNFGSLPNRFASGEWILISGNDGFEPIFREEKIVKREPVVKFYKNFENNGTFAMSTTAATPGEFLGACAEELPAVISGRFGDEEFTFMELLPQICQLWAKLNGYKAETVFERRVLTVGEPMPEAHMTYLNAPSVVTEDEKETVV